MEKYNNIVNARQKLKFRGFPDYIKLLFCIGKPPRSGDIYLHGIWDWSFKMIFILFELCMLISRQKKILSVLGATLIWFSSYNMCGGQL
ncbi:MAG: hypothetical protein ACLTLY_05945 [Agathobacter rectalis]